MSAEAGGDRREPRAVALRYERSALDAAAGAAPRVVASGRGPLAERIVEAARRHGVAVREDPDLVQLLSACELGEEIPPELYAAVAQVLAWLYRVHLASPAAAHVAAGGEARQEPPDPA